LFSGDQKDVNLSDQFIMQHKPGGIVFTAEKEGQLCEPARKISVTP
jgi:hypothetical protein